MWKADEQRRCSDTGRSLCALQLHAGTSATHRTLNTSIFDCTERPFDLESNLPLYRAKIERAGLSLDLTNELHSILVQYGRHKPIRTGIGKSTYSFLSAIRFSYISVTAKSDTGIFPICIIQDSQQQVRGILLTGTEEGQSDTLLRMGYTTLPNFGCYMRGDTLWTPISKLKGPLKKGDPFLAAYVADGSGVFRFARLAPARMPEDIVNSFAWLGFEEEHLYFLNLPYYMPGYSSEPTLLKLKEPAESALRMHACQSVPDSDSALRLCYTSGDTLKLVELNSSLEESRVRLLKEFKPGEFPVLVHGGGVLVSAEGGPAVSYTYVPAEP